MNRPVLFISTCILLASCTGSGTWTSNGPSLGGRLSAIVASPADPNTLLVASPGGGIWRTANGGTSWVKPPNYSLADYSVLHLEWDKIRNGRLYASTYSDIYASTDLGDHWSNLSHSGGYPAKLMPSTQHISDPNPFAQLKYSATESTIFWAKQGYGLYYSYDGTNFTQHYPFAGGESNPDNFIQAIAADESTGRVYFSTMAFGLQPAHLYRSTCAWTATTPCLTWELINSGLPNQSQVSSIVYGGSANRLAICLTAAASPYTRIYTTTDGSNWSPTLTQPASPAWDPRPMISPAPNQLIVGTVLAYVSNDWGNSWNSISFTGMHPDIRSFYWGTYSGNTYLWATTDGSMSSGIYHNIVKWNFIPGSTPTSPVAINTNGMSTWQAYFMAVTTQVIATPRKRIFLGSLDNGMMISDDGGVSWVPSSGVLGACGDNISLVFAPNNPNRAYARTCDGTIMARSDNAFSAATPAAIIWTTFTPAGGHSSPVAWSNAMTAVDPTNADRVCIARLNDISISTNAGAIWQAHSLPGNSKPISVYIDTDHSLYIGTLDSGIYKSVDDGVSWSPFGLNDGSFKVVSKIIHTTAGGTGGTFFAATSKGLYRKLPGGSFVNTSGDGSYVASDVEVDPSCPSRIYFSRGFISGYIQHRGGVLVSNDNGDSFTAIASGLDLHQAPVSDIQVDPIDSRYVYAAVFGLGAWTYVLNSAPGCK